MSNAPLLGYPSSRITSAALCSYRSYNSTAHLRCSLEYLATMTTPPAQGVQQNVTTPVSALYPLAGYRGYTVFYRTSNVPSSALWSEPAIVTASRSPATTPRSCTMWSISTAAGTGITPNNFLFAG